MMAHMSTAYFQPTKPVFCTLTTSSHQSYCCSTVPQNHSLLSFHCTGKRLHYNSDFKYLMQLKLQPAPLYMVFFCKLRLYKGRHNTAIFLAQVKYDMKNKSTLPPSVPLPGIKSYIGSSHSSCKYRCKH